MGSRSIEQVEINTQTIEPECVFLFEQSLPFFCPMSWHDLSFQKSMPRFALGIVLHYRSEILLLQKRQKHGLKCIFELPNDFVFAFETLPEAAHRILTSCVALSDVKIGGLLESIDYEDRKMGKIRMIWIWAELTKAPTIPLQVSSSFVYATFISYCDVRSYNTVSICSKAIRSFWFGSPLGEPLQTIIFQNDDKEPFLSSEVILLIRRSEDHAVLVYKNDSGELELPSLQLTSSDLFLDCIRDSELGAKEELAYLGSLDRWSSNKKQKFFYSFSYDEMLPFDPKEKVMFFISTLEGLRKPATPLAREGFLRFNKRFFVQLYEKEESF